MTFQLTDIPAVDAGDLAAAMRALIENGRGLVLLNGAAPADLDTARAAMQSRHHAEPQRALASFIRFRHLIEVFGARRLKDMLLGKGYTLMAPAIAVAATQRLNANRGFNPQSFLLALDNALAANVVALEPRRLEQVEAIEERRAA